MQRIFQERKPQRRTSRRTEPDATPLSTTSAVTAGAGPDVDDLLDVIESLLAQLPV